MKPFEANQVNWFQLKMYGNLMRKLDCESKQWELDLGKSLSENCRNEKKGMDGIVKINQAWKWNKEI